MLPPTDWSSRRRTRPTELGRPALDSDSPDVALASLYHHTLQQLAPLRKMTASRQPILERAAQLAPQEFDSIPIMCGLPPSLPPDGDSG